MIQFDQLSKLPLYPHISCLLCVPMRTEPMWFIIIACQFLWNLLRLLFYASSNQGNWKTISCNEGLNLQPYHWDLNLVIDWRTNNLSNHDCSVLDRCITWTLTFAFTITGQEKLNITPYKLIWYRHLHKVESLIWLHKYPHKSQ